MATTNDSKGSNAGIRTVYTELCNSYRGIDEFRSQLLSLLPLATGGLFFFITNPDGLIGKVIKEGSDVKPCNASAATILSSEIVQAIGWFGVVITLGLFAYELYGIRKCTNLIFLGKRLERDLGDIKGQFTIRPDGVLYDYFGKHFRFISINEPFAAGIIYPAVMAAWMFIAFSRTGFARGPAIIVFFAMFVLSMWYMWWLVEREIPRLLIDLGLER